MIIINKTLCCVGRQNTELKPQLEAATLKQGLTPANSVPCEQHTGNKHFTPALQVVMKTKGGHVQIM